jgi:hemin uptake protein HemP
MPATNQPLEHCSPCAASALVRPADGTSEQVKSTDLLKGQKGVEIEHNGLIYRLQTTKQGKLILTK